MKVMSLSKLLVQLDSKIDHYEVVNTNVSSSSIGWHIAHSYLTIYAISEALKRSNPIEYKPIFKPFKYLVFAMKKIPRGKGQAPKVVQPISSINLDYLIELKEKTHQQVQQLNSLPTNHFFPHPYFGNLKLKPAIKFLNIHTSHHLAIINDIVNLKS
jgi:hypothetical protein